MRLSAKIAGLALGALIVGVEFRAMVEAASDRERSPKQVTIIEFNNQGQRVGPVTVDKVVKTDAEWKKQLTPEQFQITRESGTERQCSAGYWNNHETGF